MKKALIVIIVVAIGLFVCFSLFKKEKPQEFNSYNTKDNYEEPVLEPPKKGEPDSLEPIEEFEYMSEDFPGEEGRDYPVTELNVTDRIGFSEEELEQKIAQVQSYVSNYATLMFTFNEETEDFSDNLRAYYPTDKNYIGSGACSVYREFRGVEMNSVVTDTELKTIRFLRNQDSSYICAAFVAYINTDMKNSKVPKGEYTNIFTGTIVFVDDKPTFGITDLTDVYKKDDTLMYFVEHFEKTRYEIEGEVLYTWNLLNPDGFLNDYELEYDESDTIVFDWSQQAEPQENEGAS